MRSLLNPFFYINYSLHYPIVTANGTLPIKDRREETFSQNFLMSFLEKINNACDDKLNTYSVNVMWINRKLSAKQEYICPDINKLVNVVSEWLNGNSKINIWYDSYYTTSLSVTNTYNLLGKNLESSNINLLDIRMIPETKIYEETFSDKTPVYFRADLLKVMITNYTLKNTKQKYFVYADFDVKPMAYHEIFDDITLNHLNDYGIIMAYDSNTIFENSFHIVSNNNLTIKALQDIIINLNIERSKNALKGNYINYMCPSSSSIKSLTESVFYSFTAMFKYLYHLYGYGTLVLVPTWEDFKSGNFPDGIYDYDIHGLKYFHTTSFCAMTPATKGLMLELKNKEYIIPTKKVDVPPAKCNYDDYLPDSEYSIISKFLFFYKI